jgi:hypothetical protein
MPCELYAAFNTPSSSQKQVEVLIIKSYCQNTALCIQLLSGTAAEKLAKGNLARARASSFQKPPQDKKCEAKFESNPGYCEK